MNKCYYISCTVASIRLNNLTMKLITKGIALLTVALLATVACQPSSDGSDSATNTRSGDELTTEPKITPGVEGDTTVADTL